MGSGAAAAPEGVVTMPIADPRMALGPSTLDDLYPDGPAFRQSVRTYVVLLALAALIATFGLLQDSVAAIIGAMVVAPLGGAMMALAGAFVTGRSRWQLNSFAEVVLGALMVVAIGFGVSALIPDPLVLNGSLDARTAPGLLDLGVALAAGAAGAFVTARRTGTDALPGVAIAVSLVPPLATVGVCAELGRWDDAAGALLLFLTNFAGIVVVASIVFVACGVRPLVAGRRVVVPGLVAAVVGLALISIPLASRAAINVRAVIWSNLAAPVVTAWVNDEGLRVTDWSIEEDRAILVVAGPDAPTGTDTLAAELAAAVGAPIRLELYYEPEELTVVEARP